jgi:hypothetical protein
LATLTDWPGFDEPSLRRWRRLFRIQLAGFAPRLG